MKYKISLFSLLIINLLNAQSTVTVSNALEFLKAIGSNKTIYLKDGDYVLTNHVGDGSSNVTWEQEYDGGQMRIDNVTNLKIVGKQNSRILVDPQYTWVMKFVNCSNITLDTYTMGHTNGGYCIGGVVYLDSCKNVRLTNCRMFGSGTYGMGISNTSNVVLEKCDIFKCTYGLLQLNNSKDILFTHSRFRESGEFDLITITDCINVHFKTCVFEKNNIVANESYYYETNYFFKLYSDYYYGDNLPPIKTYNITVNNCVFRGNYTENFTDDYWNILKIGVNHFDNNSFTKPLPTAVKYEPIRFKAPEIITDY